MIIICLPNRSRISRGDHPQCRYTFQNIFSSELQHKKLIQCHTKFFIQLVHNSLNAKSRQFHYFLRSSSLHFLNFGNRSSEQPHTLTQTVAISANFSIYHGLKTALFKFLSPNSDVKLNSFSNRKESITV